MQITDPQQTLLLDDAVHVKSAELWLEVGEPVEALLELQKITRRAWENPWTNRVLTAATRKMQAAE